MTTNLTANKIKDTYSQLLHVDGGPAATEKVVYSGTGVATALKVGTVSASAGNVRIAGNTISSIDENGDITLSPNGTGSVVITKIDFTDPAQARAELGLGTAALAATGSFATAAQGALADSALQPGDPISVAFGDVTGRAHGIFYDLSDQTFTADTATVVEFDTTGLAAGVSVTSSTRITFAAAGVYEIASRLQFQNTDNNDHDAEVWFRLNGTDIPNSASELVIPKSSDGGVTCQAVTGLLQVTAGQYLEVVVAVENAGVTLHHVDAQTVPYNRPVIPAVILVVNRIA